MIVPANVRRRFMAALPYLNLVSDKVRDTVFNFCDKNGFAYVGRPKALESLAEKIETGRYEKWSSLDDLFACSIVIPTLASEDRVVDFLKETFREIGTKRRGSTKKPPDAFRFEATRFTGQLRALTEQDTNNPAHSISFEVQIRSAFEHAWSVTTHALAYKSGTVDWKARRLSHQLKAAVEQLDALVLGFEQSSKSIIEHDWPELTVQRRIVDKLSALAKQGEIPEELVPKDWSRFAENLATLARSSKKAPKREVEPFVLQSLEALVAEIGALGPQKIPKSISLLQLAIGVLCRSRLLEPPLYRYCPLITPELLEFYPDAKRLESACFSFD
jgi:ppGpp synthetase/RelA/SpoT-type nucleotidyltranferase